MHFGKILIFNVEYVTIINLKFNMHFSSDYLLICMCSLEVKCDIWLVKRLVRPLILTLGHNRNTPRLIFSLQGCLFGLHMVVLLWHNYLTLFWKTKIINSGNVSNILNWSVNNFVFLNSNYIRTYCVNFDATTTYNHQWL